MMRHKNRFILMALALITVISIVGCTKDDGRDDDLLGSSRPDYNMLFDIKSNGLYLTEWSGIGPSTIVLVVFERDYCIFSIYNYLTGVTTTDKYFYTFAHPVATFNPEDTSKGVLKGTTKSGRVLVSDEMNIVDEKTAAALIKVTRLK